MVDHFFSAKRTLSRARHHIADLSTSLHRVTRTKPWAYDIERDLDGITEIHKIKIAERFQDDLPCIVFDVVSNLRACLDQTSYAVCVANGHPEVDSAYFPIRKAAEFLPKALRDLKYLPLEIRTLFAQFKPYQGGNDALWGLNVLVNTKKHAGLVPINLGNIEVSFPAANGTATISAPFTVVGFGSSYNAEKNEIILAKLPPDPNRGTNTKITFAIVFDHPDKVINGQKPVSFLNAMCCEVERILVATEAECRRIRLIP